MQKGITIGRWDFPNRQAALNHCRAILYSDHLSTRLEGENAEFVDALFHIQADEKFTRTELNIVGFYRNMHRLTGACFFALTSDGEKVYFSIKKSIDLLTWKT